jgi:hypothetical protein
MDPVYAHTILHNDPLVAAQLRETRIATSTALGTDTSSSRKRPRSTNDTHAKRTRTQDLSEILADTADEIAGSDDMLLDTAPRTAPRSVLPPRASRKGLRRIDRQEAAKRKRRTAAQTPDAPRRRGENRSASVFNRAPGWQSATAMPAGATIVDLT